MFRRIHWFGFAMCFATAVWARPDPPVTRSPRVDFGKVEIRTTRVANHLYVLEG